MSLEPTRFLSVAEFVSQDTDDEARLRTAVGRVYYASFLQAREVLMVRTRTGRAHREVIGSLRKRDVAAGNQLDKLEELRTLADYDLDTDNAWRDKWTMARSYATHVLRRLERLA